MFFLFDSQKNNQKIEKCNFSDFIRDILIIFTVQILPGCRVLRMKRFDGKTCFYRIKQPSFAFVRAILSHNIFQKFSLFFLQPGFRRKIIFFRIYFGTKIDYISIFKPPKKLDEKNSNPFLQPNDTVQPDVKIIIVQRCSS